MVNGGSGCGVAFILVLLQRSDNRLQHVPHHLEARVDDEVYKTYAHKYTHNWVDVFQVSSGQRVATATHCLLLQ